MNRNRNLFWGILLLVVVTSAITFAISGFVFLGWNYFNPSYEISFNPKEVNLENIKKYNQVRSILKSYYYEDIDDNAMLEGSIAGMAYALGDPYTVYYTKEQMDLLREISSKSVEEYVGIGVNVMMSEDGLLTIAEPFEGSPAREAGMLPGDKITKVNGEDVAGMDQDIIVSKIKGPVDTPVKVTVYRPSEGKQVEFDLVRKKIEYDINIRSEKMEDDIGYIWIKSFNDVNIDTLFKQHLDNLLDKQIKGLIIDMRDNPGGYYGQTVKIADRLLPEGLVVYTEDKNGNKDEELSDGTELNLPMVVLINGNSASASEVLAGAIKDHNKGILVGTRSFGKGIVQSVIPLEDGSGIKVTFARYYTPLGVCIHEIGINPHITVESLEKYKNMPVSFIPREDDVQLTKALEEIKARVD